MVKKRLLLIGGGSGGHIMPLMVIADELADRAVNYEIKVWCDKKILSMSKGLLNKHPNIKVERIFAGKFRRYHHLKWWRHFTWSIFWPNFKDLFKVWAGFCQSFIKLIIWRPNLIFAKGGYVCLPVGLIAKLLGIKLIIHDSDTMPGLTNRILAKSAARIATGFPTEYYSYSSKKAVFTGIPIRSEYQPVDSKQQVKLKKELGFSDGKPLVVVMGGGLGSRCLNNSIVASQHKLSQVASVVLATGDASYNEVAEQITTPIKVQSFYNNIYKYVLASDLVVCRAGATTLAELAASRKLTLVVPSAKLAGGHQLKNAAVLQEAEAAFVISEDQIVQSPGMLTKKIIQLLADKKSENTQIMLDNFHKMARLDSVSAVTDLIIGEIEG